MAAQPACDGVSDLGLGFGCDVVVLLRLVLRVGIGVASVLHSMGRGHQVRHDFGLRSEGALVIVLGRLTRTGSGLPRLVFPYQENHGDEEGHGSYGGSVSLLNWTGIRDKSHI